MASPQRPLELLAPARSADIAREAILHGADAVYIGGPAFGARQGAGNAVSDIEALTRFARRFHARVYVTLNTILHDDELEAAQKLVREVYEAGADALIVQDMGLLELDLPPIALHASTQCDIRSAEKAAFLASAGFSQIVLARELSLEEISAVRAQIPAEVSIEHFVHGALCVSFSGQCYISHATTGRSANRGECSQACRLPYTLSDGEGRVVAFEKHLLSLKDNNQSANLAALVAAGVQSFKIEGRYKDMSYVKNITGHYRRLLDALIDARSDLCHASSGSTELFFTPDPEKSFHREHTDYFTHGRQDDIGAFDAPGYRGERIGTVTRVQRDSFELEAAPGIRLANGDGLAWLHQRSVQGLLANVASQLAGNRWRIQPNEALQGLKGLVAGTEIFRNRDHAWEQMLTRASARRLIGVELVLGETPTGFTLSARDEDGICAQAALDAPHEPARDAARARDTLSEQLSRLGNTDFVARQITLACSEAWFLPAGQLNALRREAISRLEAAREAAHPRAARRAESSPPPQFPQQSLAYLGNVYNAAARAFYARHGVALIDKAYEANAEPGEVSLMITKHCLRHSFKLCPKQARSMGIRGRVSAEPMTLSAGRDRFTLRFDCAACEMHVIGRIRPHILRALPAGQQPLTFVPKRSKP